MRKSIIIFTIVLMTVLLCGCGNTSVTNVDEQVSTDQTLYPSAKEGMPQDSDSSSEAGNQNNLSESNPSDSTAQYSEGAETNTSNWYGSYIIQDYIIRGVTAIGNDEAEGLMMCLMEYGTDEFNSDGILLEAPAYRETLVSREEFAEMYSGSGGGCTFETFGIEGGLSVGSYH